MVDEASIDLAEARRAQLEAYLRELAQLMGLGDWRITVSPEPAEEGDENADVYLDVTVDVAQRATVRAAARFWGEPPESQRRYSCHELGHLPAERIGEALGLVAEVVPKKTMAVIAKAFEEAEEHIVWWIALRLAPSMPLPPRFP